MEAQQAQDDAIEAVAAAHAAQQAAALEQWKDAVVVTGEGSAAADAAAAAAAADKAILAKLRKERTIAFTDLAAFVRLPVSSAVARVRALEAEGRLTGIADERGRYVYLAPEELDEIAERLKVRGRVTAADAADVFAAVTARSKPAERQDLKKRGGDDEDEDDDEESGAAAAVAAALAAAAAAADAEAHAAAAPRAGSSAGTAEEGMALSKSKKDG